MLLSSSLANTIIYVVVIIVSCYLSSLLQAITIYMSLCHCYRTCARIPDLAGEGSHRGRRVSLFGGFLYFCFCSAAVLCCQLNRSAAATVASLVGTHTASRARESICHGAGTTIIFFDVLSIDRYIYYIYVLRTYYMYWYTDCSVSAFACGCGAPAFFTGRLFSYPSVPGLLLALTLLSFSEPLRED